MGKRWNVLLVFHATPLLGRKEEKKLRLTDLSGSVSGIVLPFHFGLIYSVNSSRLIGDLIILPERVFHTAFPFWGVFVDLALSSFDFAFDAGFPVSVNVFSFWDACWVRLTPQPGLVVTDVSLFAWYIWRLTSGIGAVSGDFSGVFYYADAALLQYRSDMILIPISASQSPSSTLSTPFHEVWTVLHYQEVMVGGISPSD